MTRPTGNAVGDRPPAVVMYTLAACPHCTRARAILSRLGIPFEERPGDGVPRFRALMGERTGGWTVPQIVVRGEPIGGAAELARLARRGVLVALVNGEPFPVARVRRRLSLLRVATTIATAPFGGHCSPWWHVIELRDRDGRLIERRTLPSLEQAVALERLLKAGST